MASRVGGARATLALVPTPPRHSRSSRALFFAATEDARACAFAERAFAFAAAAAAAPETETEPSGALLSFAAPRSASVFQRDLASASNAAAARAPVAASASAAAAATAAAASARAFKLRFVPSACTAPSASIVAVPATFDAV